jgi:hypothetical protein
LYFPFPGLQVLHVSICHKFIQQIQCKYYRNISLQNLDVLFYNDIIFMLYNLCYVYQIHDLGMCVDLVNLDGGNINISIIRICFKILIRSNDTS